MIESLALALKEHNIVCHRNKFEQVTLGFGNRSKPIVLEPYVEFREGLIDADEIGAFTFLGGDRSSFRHIERIGRFCSIAGGIQTGQMEHPTNILAMHPLFYGRMDRVWPDLAPYYDANSVEFKSASAAAQESIAKRSAKIVIGNDVWIGYGALIRRGVRIGDGAMIASRAVVTSDVPPYAVVGGVPAKVIKYRFPQEVIERLLKCRWWDYGLAAMAGVDVSRIPECLDRLEKNIQGLEVWRPKKVVVGQNNTVTVL